MDTIQRTIMQKRLDQRTKIQNAFTNSGAILKGETANDISKAVSSEDTAEEDISKAKEEVEENPFDKAAKESEEDDKEENVEKSDIMSALDRDSNIKVAKTGKEIKAQVTDILLPELNANLAVKTLEAEMVLKECGNAPTKDVSNWWTNDIKMIVPLKIYDWEETYIKTSDDRMISSLSAEHSKEVNNVNHPGTLDEATARRKYNDVVRELCEILVDLKACEILSSIEEGKKFELSPRQVITFRF